MGTFPVRVCAVQVNRSPELSAWLHLETLSPNSHTVSVQDGPGTELAGWSPRAIAQSD